MSKTEVAEVEGRIIVTSKEKRHTDAVQLKVLDIGPKCTDVKIGDHAFVSPKSMNRIDASFVMVDEDDILGVEDEEA